MKRGGGGKKGAEFERDICKSLSNVVSSGTRKDLFWRTSMSGGRATIMNRKGDRNLSQMGDICSIDPLGSWLTSRYLIECKFHKDVELVQYLLNGKGKIAKWVQTMEEHAEKQGLTPILIFKQNFMNTLVLTKADTICKEAGQAVPLPVPLLVTNKGYRLRPYEFLIGALVVLVNPITIHGTRRRPK